METMRMKWGNPLVEVQQFTPQEFVAVCYEQVDASALAPGEYKLGWCIREATGSNLEAAVASDGERTGYFLQAPYGFEAGQEITALIAETTPQTGQFVQCHNYPDYAWLDSYHQDGIGRLTKGDQIKLNGNTFTLDGSSYSVVAHPSSAIFRVTGHS